MKIYVKKETLLGAIKNVQKAVDSSENANYVHLQAENGILSLAVCGNLLSIRCKLLAEEVVVEEPGSVFLSVSKFYHCISLMPNEKLQIQTKENTLVVSRKKTRMVLDTTTKVPVLEFSSFNETAVKITISEIVLKQLIEDVVYAASADTENNTPASSVNIEIVDGALRMTACDGIQVSRRDIDLKDKVSSDTTAKCMIKKRNLVMIGSLLVPSFDNMAEFCIGNMKYGIRTRNIEVVGAILFGDYYNMQKLFTEPPSETEIKMSKEELLAAMKRCAYAIDESSRRPCIIEGKNTVRIHAKGKIEVEEELFADIDGAPFRFGVNPNCMENLLKVYPEEMVTMSFKGKKLPLYVKHGSYTMLLALTSIPD